MLRSAPGAVGDPALQKPDPADLGERLLVGIQGVIDILLGVSRRHDHPGTRLDTVIQHRKRKLLTAGGVERGPHVVVRQDADLFVAFVVCA